jgi:hypothetical protein
MTLRRNTTPFVLLFIAFFWRHAIPSFKKARRFSFVTQCATFHSKQKVFSKAQKESEV